MSATKDEVLEVAGRAVTISNPDKIFFPKSGYTKLDLVRYYVAVAEGALRGVASRPMALKRFVNGAEGEAFFQKRAPTSRPEWIETVELSFPSGRTAEEIVVRDAAQLAWIINLGCIDLNPHPVRSSDLDHPDELRVDLDPVPGVPWAQIRDVAMVTRDVLKDFGLVGWPKTSGSRGMHVYCRIEPRWTFPEVRRAAVALAREVERRAPEIATTRWRTPAYRRHCAGTRCPPARQRPLPSQPYPGALRRSAIPRKGSTRRSGHWRHCSSFPRSTRRPASAMRPGRRTSPSRPASRPEYSCRDASARTGRRHPKVRSRRPLPARRWVRPVAAARRCP